MTLMIVRKNCQNLVVKKSFSFIYLFKSVSWTLTIKKVLKINKIKLDIYFKFGTCIIKTY